MHPRHGHNCVYSVWLKQTKYMKCLLNVSIELDDRGFAIKLYISVNYVWETRGPGHRVEFWAAWLLFLVLSCNSNRSISVESVDPYLQQEELVYKSRLCVMLRRTRRGFCPTVSCRSLVWGRCCHLLQRQRRGQRAELHWLCTQLAACRRFPVVIVLNQPIAHQGEKPAWWLAPAKMYRN